MAEFLIELYVPCTGAERVEQDAVRARLAAETLTSEGTPVRYLRSIFVPEDETCFLLIEAGSADVVREALDRAQLPFERLAESLVSLTRGGTGHVREGDVPEHGRGARRLVPDCGGSGRA